MFDWVSRRYGVLPSQLLIQGNSFDLLVADVGQKWENYQQQKTLNKQKGVGTAPPVPHLTEEDMMAMIRRVKEKHG